MDWGLWLGPTAVVVNGYLALRLLAERRAAQQLSRKLGVELAKWQRANRTDAARHGYQGLIAHAALGSRYHALRMAHGFGDKEPDHVMDFLIRNSEAAEWELDRRIEAWRAWELQTRQAVQVIPHFVQTPVLPHACLVCGKIGLLGDDTDGSRSCAACLTTYVLPGGKINTCGDVHEYDGSTCQLHYAHHPPHQAQRDGKTLRWHHREGRHADAALTAQE